MSLPSLSTETRFKIRTGVHCSSTLERRSGRVVRAIRLWCIKLPDGREFEAGLRHPTTGKLSLSTQQLIFFESGKDKAVKGEGWAPPLSSCAQDTVEL